MEGAAIGHVASLNNVPFLVIRSMSDKADDEGSEMEPFNEEAAAKVSAVLVKEILKNIG